MSYDPSSSLRGQAQAGPAAIQQWFLQHAAGGAAFVHLPVAPLPPDLGRIICDECADPGLNADLIAAQVAHESSYAQSDFARNRFNYAGIGAVNDAPGQAIHFPNARAGIHAQCAHLLTYVLGNDNPIKDDDPRYAAAEAAGFLGAAQVLKDLDGRWAWPGQGYSASIAALANQLVQFAQQQGGGTVSVSDIFGAPLAWMPAAEGNYDTSRGKVRLFIVHDEEASTAISAVNRFQTPGQQASSHFITDPANGRIIQCVGTANTAYTCGNYALNQVSVNVENPGFEGRPYPDAVVDYCARVGAYSAKKFNIPVVRLTKQQVAAGAAGFCGHEDIPDPDHPGLWGGTDHHTDPGATWPWDKFLALVNQYLGGTAHPQQGRPVDRIINGHRLGGGFKGYYEWLESRLGPDEVLMLIGLPLSDEIDEDGLTVQYFERARFEWHPGKRPDRWDTLLGRVGADAFASKHPS